LKFFVPTANNKEEETKYYDAIIKFNGGHGSGNWEITDRHIFSIDFVHDGKRYYAEVGKFTNFNGEMVMAILESNAFMVVTMNRGFLRDMPILVGKEAAYAVVDFEK